MLDTQFGRVIIPTRTHAILRDVLDTVVATAGLAVVRGPVGIGKTFALRREFARLEAEGVQVVQVTSSPELEGSIGSFLRAVLSQWGISGTTAVAACDALADLLLSAHPFRQDGKRCIFVVDEAQGLKPNILEVLRALWDKGDNARNGNTYAPAFGLVLVGNDTFLNKGGKMRKAEFRPLMSRVMIDMILSRPDATEFSFLAKALLPDHTEAQAILARFGAEAGSLRAIDKVYRLAMTFAGSGDEMVVAVGRAIKLSGGK